MTFITSLGYSQFFFAAFLVIIFGIDFKKGFILIQVLLLTAAVTEFLKNTFALPRPFHVDSNVIRPDISKANDAPFKNMGALSFLGLLPQEVVDYYRCLPEKISYGIPSGHTSAAVTFWGSIIILFENKYIKYISIVLIVLVPFSRLYLGRHFPADVLAGYVLGALILLLLYKTFFKHEELRSFLFPITSKNNIGIIEIVFTIYLIALPFLFFILLPHYFSKFTGYWFGINLASFLIPGQRIPEFGKGYIKRIAAVVSAVVVFYVIEILMKFIIDAFSLTQFDLGLFITGAVVSFTGIIFTLNLNRKLKLYK
jgi:membrane-associated phospholipid phosphatase